MMKALGTALVSCALVATAAAASDKGRDPEKVTKELAKYEQTGETKACIKVSRIRNTKVLDDYTIIFNGRNKTSYLVNLENRCHGLGFEESIAYTVRAGSLCRSDIFSVINRGGGFIRSTCGFASFEVMKKLPKDQQKNQPAQSE
ncbi:hypothetical protein KFE96_06265 [Kordiimonas sp. SCSIO 12603]|uniref:DUF6491 family protein n=1 Tax=Kordiimonas sp. SCSIO 12603 TaxID=2829596 RepID=UPI002104F436|nr:DUF6491 family protein [Kordiimonas sp. SCSIO 12603]UTW59903.1 hypothetical protein KFE96_06265 [Kordiimonas sp. SCSIO 12603]